ncbi:MAG: GxxExxY protein [Candidatus Liptonbacteria bacterium]|nr:GxxExxY protein [Candidatus Liptonbacteria bacterium]
MDAVDNKKELIYPELGYEILGAAFRVFNEIGYGLPEKVYQAALEKEFEIRGIPCRRESFSPAKYRGECVARYFADFIVDGKIVVELKVVKKLTYSHARQLLTYLRNSGIRLGILLYFTSEGVKFRRVINSGRPKAF